ncbi:hypothetical protein GCM10025768_14740 [Microbacterium pseudoresistens]
MGAGDSSAGALPIEQADSRNALATVRVSAAVTFFLVLNMSSSFRTEPRPLRGVDCCSEPGRNRMGAFPIRAIPIRSAL